MDCVVRSDRLERERTRHIIGFFFFGDVGTFKVSIEPTIKRSRLAEFSQHRVNELGNAFSVSPYVCRKPTLSSKSSSAR